MSEPQTAIDLSFSMAKCLCDLYSESGGRIGITYPIKAHWNTIEGLFKRGLIMRDAQIENGKVVRYIALTPTGAQYSCEHLEVVINAGVINTDRPRKCVSLFFEYDKKKYPTHVTAYERVEVLKGQGDFRPTMIDLINMDKELESGKVDLLMKAYPEAVQTLRDTLRLEVEADIKRQETHVLKEMIRQTVKDAIEEVPQSRPDAPNSRLQPVSGSTQASGGLKAIGGHKTFTAPPPIDDEDDDDLGLEIVKSKDGGMNATMNFLKSMEALANAKPTGESTLTPRQKARLEKDARNE